MRFNVLGPLEVIQDGELVPLGGIKQRATLGLLLLQANRAVATSQLLAALWSDNPPVSARKMLQNAVSGLRRVLGGPGGVTLETRPPGYALCVEPEQVDWLRFQDLVERGRAESAAGRHFAAARILREAVTLWRGPVLSDLTEAGVDLPGLTMVQGSRLDVLEDCVEAELAIGRHYELVGELMAEAEAEPARERLCGQVMLALYRCGRQAEALAVYRRTRSVLADQLGLDPGHELRDLERGILNHDPGLVLPNADLPTSPPPRPTVTATAPPPVTSVTVERKPVSVLLIRADLAAQYGGYDPEDVDETFKSLTVMVREEVEHLGGVVHGTIASVWMVLFGVPRTREDDAARAISAAMAVRDRIARCFPGAGTVGEPGITRAAISTGEALVTYRQGDDATARVEVSGSVLMRCQQLLALSGPGEVQVCDTTKQVGGCVFGFANTPGRPGRWSVLSVAPTSSRHADIPFVERDREMHLLLTLIEESRQHRRSGLVTLLGESGIGKSRLVLEVGETVARTPDPIRYLTGQVRPLGKDRPLDAVADVIRSYAGIDAGDSARLVAQKLATSVHALLGAGDMATWIIHRVRPLVLPAHEGADATADVREMSEACRLLLEEIAAESPLVVVLEDVHQADESLLALVEELVGDSRSIPLTVIATARPELQRRRPGWGGGKPNSTTITLEPLSVGAAHDLLAALLDRYGLNRSIDDRELEAGVDGNPLFALEYVRMLREGVSLELELASPALNDDDGGTDNQVVLLPHSVYSIVAARLDALARREKAVLQDAAVFGETVQAPVIAVISGRSPFEVRECLDGLERGGLLDRTRDGGRGSETRYAFRSALVRDVAYSQIPRALRADKHRRAATWLSDQATSDNDLLAHHRQRAKVFTTATRPEVAYTVGGSF
ncbi:BTAD domain-containing putative transcriptional regulator [Micromonospora sp. NPDC050397]|uniref:BTAD domain-containing putative transcriptional regulator n=1 Tax=Micromonospora sp. NPDC050397 TaxID=3364279 RepID=UPI00384D72E1